MSRLQKKKPVTEKKKKKIDQEKKKSNGSGSASFSSSKTSGAAGLLKPKSDKSVTDTNPGEPNIFQKAIDFVREVKVELKKVTWPTRKQTTGTTIVVIIFVFVVAGFLGLFDLGLSKLVQVVLT